jgi:hypothetical protein
MVLFSSVTAFVEQVNRQKRWEKRDTLDTLIRIYTGPTEQVDIFKPNNGAPDQQYNLMTVIRATDKDLGHGRGISEVTVEYQGKLTSGSRYTSVPTISTSWSEGEISYSRASVLGNGAPVTYSYSHRYTGRNVTIAYITNFRPRGEPTNLGIAKGYMGFTNQFDILSGISYSVGVSSGSPISDMRCTDVRVQDLADGWFRVTETYQSRMFPGAAQAAPNAGKIFYSTTFLGSSTEQEKQDQAATSGYVSGLAGALAAATAEVDNPATAAVDNLSSSGAVTTQSTLPISPPGSVGADTALNTGIDPAWQASYQAPAAAVTTTPSADIATGSGDATTSGGSGIGDHPI